MFKIIVSLSALCLFFSECRDGKSEAASESTSIKRDGGLITDPTITKFSLAYPENLLLDSNSLIFYCARTFDTSCLIHIRKNDSGIRGVYYEMLPAYHQYVNDFADEKNNLLFFEGYNFLIDSTVWQMIKERAKILVQAKDSISKNEKFVDGSRYALYHNLQSCRGDSNHEVLFEDFYTFLRQAFLEKIIQSRKPRFWRK